MTDKEKFLHNGFIDLIETLRPQAKGIWGVMNAHEMVEHMTTAFRMASGKDVYELVSPPENIERLQAFVMSDREFKPNTKNSLLPEVAVPAQKASMQESINELKTEIADFFAYFKKNPNAILMNPFFGELNYDLWVTLLYKHCFHHAKQFELVK